jgi:hypothetical protein
MLHCKLSIAAMQTSLLRLVSGIHKLTLDHEAESLRTSRKGDPDVQDCFHRPRTLQVAVRPRHGHHRPPADGQCPHLQPQRRPAPLRSLRPAGIAFAAAPLSLLNAKRNSTIDEWPRSSGPFFIRQMPDSSLNFRAAEALQRSAAFEHAVRVTLDCLAYQIPKWRSSAHTKRSACRRSYDGYG